MMVFTKFKPYPYRHIRMYALYGGNDTLSSLTSLVYGVKWATVYYWAIAGEDVGMRSTSGGLNNLTALFHMRYIKKSVDRDHWHDSC